MIPAFSEPSQVTGPERALHEIVCAASFQQAREKMAGAMLQHCISVMLSRMLLEGALPSAADLASGAGEG